MAIELIDINKRFGTVQANRSINLNIGDGEVLALLGENGAGKSTLMKILYGFYSPDEGEIRIDGERVRMESPRTAMAHGIGMVFQQFSLIPALTVRENLLLAYPRAPWWQGRGNAQANQVLTRLRDFAPDISPDTLVADLSVGQQQQVELVKVLNLDARLVVLDEPTSVLSPLEAERLWQLVRRLADGGHSVVFITHKLEDVMACADRVAVMRAGELVDSCDREGLTEERLVQLMMGDQPGRPVAVKPPQSEVPQLIVRNVSAHRNSSRLTNINFSLAAGEILGVAGVAGNGQDLLADALSGFLALDDGEVIVDGDAIHNSDGSVPQDARLGYIPEHPFVNAIAAELSNCVNLSLRRYGELGFFPSWSQESAGATDLIKRFDVRPPLPDLASGRLSGGNLQKLVIARELSLQRRVVIACYPTMGLDVHATEAVYANLFAQAERGACVVWISEDLDDLLQYAHRISVIYHGAVVTTVANGEADRYQLGRWMTAGRAA